MSKLHGLETLLADTAALVYEGCDEAVLASVEVECDVADLDDDGNTDAATAVWYRLRDAGHDVRDDGSSSQVGNGRYMIRYTVYAAA